MIEGSLQLVIGSTGDLLDRLFGGPLYSKPGENSLKTISENDMDKE